MAEDVQAGPIPAARSWARAVEALLFDPACEVCGADDGPLCPGCRAEMVEAAGVPCPRCALSVGPWGRVDAGCSWCRGRALGFDAAEALGPYHGPIRALCLAMKRSHGAWLAAGLVDALVESRGASLREHRAEVVVPVPLHWWRRWQRGYNQSEELAGHLARRLGVPMRRALRRVKPTPKLADVGRTGRAALLKGAFRTTARARVEGKTVLLVDDILTTAATCGAAAHALKAAGAKKVIAVVIARAEGRS